MGFVLIQNIRKEELNILDNANIDYTPKPAKIGDSIGVLTESKSCCNGVLQLIGRIK